jgi:tetratricopeptide (TPR) repeat protein
LRTFCVLAVFVLSVGCAAKPSADSDETYKRGLSVANSDTAGAIKIFEDGLQADPRHYRMRFALARLQYDTGETQFLAERDAVRAARDFEENHKTADVQKAQHEAQDRHEKAFPFYRAARENLQIVVEKDQDDARKAWASELLMKCDMFFEDFDSAVIHLDKAIELGHPTGAKRLQMEEFLTELKNSVKGHKGGG